MLVCDYLFKLKRMEVNKIELSLTTEEYKYLLEVFNLGLVAKDFVDEQKGLESDSDLFFKVQDEVCKAGVDLGIEEIYYDKENNVHAVDPESEMGNDVADFADMLFNDEEDEFDIISLN